MSLFRSSFFIKIFKSYNTIFDVTFLLIHNLTHCSVNSPFTSLYSLLSLLSFSADYNPQYFSCPKCAAHTPGNEECRSPQHSGHSSLSLVQRHCTVGKLGQIMDKILVWSLFDTNSITLSSRYPYN